MLQNLFDLIASNFLIVLVILGGIISFFQDKNKKEAEREEKNPQQQEQKPANPSQRRSRPMIPELRRMQRTGNGYSQESAANEKQAEEAAGKAMEETKRLLEMASRSEEQGAVDPDRVIKRSAPIKRHARSHPLFQKGLDRERLVESVIMSEVLGPPRAVKPHAPGRSSRRH